MSNYNGITALVLGASGFIGRWVAKALCVQQANLCLAVRDRKTAERVFRENGISGNIFEVDLCNYKQLERLFSTVEPAITFNLVGYGVDPSERNDDLAYHCNAYLVKAICRVLAGTRNREWEGQSIIHAGSALEYGETGGNLAEESVPRPTTLYGKSKLAGTCLFDQSCSKYEINGLTARLFSVYGDGEHHMRLLPTLIDAAANKQPILLTSGKQLRDFTYVGDVAEGLLRLGLCRGAKPGEVINLATGQLTSVREFTETAARILGISKIRLQFGALPTRPEEMHHENVSIDRLRMLTGWKPEITVAKGILETVRHHEVVSV